MMEWFDVCYWLFFIVLIEVATDWLKFCLIVKFCSNSLRAETFEAFRRVLIADVLLCRADSSDSPARQVPIEPKVVQATLPFVGIHSFSHVPARRIGFSGVP